MASRSSMDMDEKTSNSSASSILSCHTTLSDGSSGSTAEKNAANRLAAAHASPDGDARNSQQPPSAAPSAPRRCSEDSRMPSPPPTERGWNSGPPAVCRGPAANQRKVLEQASMNAFLRVLVAEDNMVNQKVLLKVLQRVTPHSPVFVANNGQEALQVGLLSQRPAASMALPVERHCKHHTHLLLLDVHPKVGLLEGFPRFPRENELGAA